MPNHKRTAHLLPAGIAGLAATLSIAVAMVGTAAAAQARDYRGVQDFRAAESDAGLAPVTTPVQDFGAQDFRGVQDFRAAESDARLAPVTTPVQDFGAQDFRGVQDFRAAESDAGLSVDAPSATEITSALQPGQTSSQVVVRVASYDPAHEHLTSAPWPTSAPQPGQTSSQVVVRVASYDPAHEHLTSALWPTSAPQPGQTGW